MAKTADVLKAIWADPWFLALPPDGKLIFLWGISNEHSNLAGLYVVAQETIQHETKFSVQRLTKALEVVHPKMTFRSDTGVVCIPSRPKHVRMKTDQIRKSILRAVEECPHSEIQSHYIERYGVNRWLGDSLRQLASELGLSELQQGSRNLGEVPSHSQSQSQTTKERDNGKSSKPKSDSNQLPEGFDPVLADAVTRCLPILQRTAEARGANPVTLLAVARAVESYPVKDHARVAGEVEHWTVHGNGRTKQAKDIVSRFRNFLDGSPDVLRVSKTPDGKPSPYEARVREVAA